MKRGVESAGPIGSALGDRYLVALALSLAAYAFLGKGFAYFGVPPLFVGELLLTVGLVVLLRSGCAIALLATFPFFLLLILTFWVVLRTLPFVATYRIDALRDSVLVVYSAFAFVVAAVLLENPVRLNRLFSFYGLFAAAYGYAGGLAYFISKQLNSIMPTWPISGIPVMFLRAGEVSVHLSGAAVFAILGFRKPGVLWIVLLVLGIALVSAQSRGGMLSILFPVCAAIVLGGRTRAAAPAILVALGLLTSAYLLNFDLPIGNDERTVSVRQMVDNLLSVFVSGDDSLDNTKEWRLRWWNDIINYTIRGEYFWTGKGFGINLAESDGFLGTADPGAPPLRSPHNAHMTILARAGVPGLTLWLLGALAWYGLVIRNWLDARRRSEQVWADFFLFIMCYLGAIFIDVSFDVALEGPMLGIWFWVLFGVGVGSTMIYRGRFRSNIKATLAARTILPTIGALLALWATQVVSSQARAAEPGAAPSDWVVKYDLFGKATQLPLGSWLAFPCGESAACCATTIKVNA